MCDLLSRIWGTVPVVLECCTLLPAITALVRHFTPSFGPISIFTHGFKSGWRGRAVFGSPLIRQFLFCGGSRMYRKGLALVLHQYGGRRYKERTRASLACYPSPAPEVIIRPWYERTLLNLAITRKIQITANTRGAGPLFHALFRASGATPLS
jgi:hypothetical protein